MIKKLLITLFGGLMLFIGIGGVSTPAMASVRSGVIIKYSPASDFVAMDVLPWGDYDNGHYSIELRKGDTYKVPSKYASTLKVTIYGDSWRQRWDLSKAGYGACHDMTSGNSYSKTFKPSHDVRTRIDLLAYGREGCLHL
jgi:hypothetical protein